jgi:hypothetical protein
MEQVGLAAMMVQYTADILEFHSSKRAMSLSGRGIGDSLPVFQSPLLLGRRPIAGVGGTR